MKDEPDHEINPLSLDLCFTCVCSECGGDLCWTSDHSVDAHGIKVDPCEMCLENAQDEIKAKLGAAEVRNGEA